MTEKDLAELLDLETKNLGLTKGTFTIVAFGPNTTEPHHYPTESKLKQNDTILIDYWAKCDGYYSDITRCFAIGAPTDLYMEVYRVVERAQASAIELIKDGVKVKIIDEAAREVISTSGYPNYEHPTGHGIGLEIHESPFLNSKSDVKLRTGDVITVEPGVYIPGKFGIRIEDDVLVTETGYEVLTSHCPHEPLLTSHTD
jgi:Xaa-Pro aminopeptidase